MFGFCFWLFSCKKSQKQKSWYNKYFITVSSKSRLCARSMLLGAFTFFCKRKKDSVAGFLKRLGWVLWNILLSWLFSDISPLANQSITNAKEWGGKNTSPYNVLRIGGCKCYFALDPFFWLSLAVFAIQCHLELKRYLHDFKTNCFTFDLKMTGKPILLL